MSLSGKKMIEIEIALSFYHESTHYIQFTIKEIISFFHLLLLYTIYFCKNQISVILIYMIISLSVFFINELKDEPCSNTLDDSKHLNFAFVYLAFRLC